MNRQHSFIPYFEISPVCKVFRVSSPVSTDDNFRETVFMNSISFLRKHIVPKSTECYRDVNLILCLESRSLGLHFGAHVFCYSVNSFCDTQSMSSASVLVLLLLLLLVTFRPSRRLSSALTVVLV